MVVVRGCEWWCIPVGWLGADEFPGGLERGEHLALSRLFVAAPTRESGLGFISVLG